MAYNPYDKASMLERKIKELEKIVENKNRTIEELKNRYDDMFRHMSNRCHSFTCGSLCIYCRYKYDCKACAKTDGSEQDAQTD